MAAHLISLVKNRITLGQSNEDDSFALADLSPSRVRRVSKGTGVLYFYWLPSNRSASWHRELYFSEETPAKIAWPNSEESIVTFDGASKFSCSGIITGSGEGFLTAPTVKLDIAEGQDIGLMLLSPRTSDHELTVEKPSLSIPEEDANVAVSSEGGELRCAGSVSSTNFKAARLVLNRNPGLPEYKSGYNEDLCRLEGPGEISAGWKPVARSFEECLFAFHPMSLGSADIDYLARWLGAKEDEETGAMGNLVVGDGPGMDYSLRLVLDLRFHRSRSDETRLFVN